MKKFLTWFILAVLSVTAFCFSASAETEETTAYNAQAAVTYAQNHWNDGVGVCDEFVKACLAEGNIDILAGGVTPVMNALVDAGFGELINVSKTEDGIYVNSKDNSALEAGDVLSLYCNTCQRYTHTVLITGFDENGNVQIHGHNPAQNSYVWVGTFNHIAEDGKTNHDQGGYRLDAVHIYETAFHKHDFESNLYETAHPHKMYAQCQCGVKYYLGWNATVKSCTTCNKPLGDKPVIISLEYSETNGVSLEWSTVEGAVSYQVHRAKSADGAYYKIGSPQVAVTFRNASIEAGVVYYYKIEAILEDGTSVFSAVKSTTGETFDEDAVESPVVTGTVRNDSSAYNGKPKLTWPAVDNAHEYKVYRSTTGKTDSYKLQKTTTSTSYTNTSAVAGTKYYYKVCAVSENGTVSEYSKVVTLTAKCAVPELTLSSVASTGKIKLSWNAVDGAKSYKIYRATSKNGTYSLLKTTTGTSLTNTSITAGKTYYYKIRAIHASNADGNSYLSSYVSRTCDLARPTVELTNVTSTGKIKISWNAVDGAKEYKVYRATSKTGTYSLLKTTTGTSLTNTSTTAGTTYYYKVRAIHTNSAANSAYSTIVSRTCDLPQTKLTATNVASTGKIKLSWTAVDGAAKYEVWRSLTGKSGSYSKLTTVTGTSVTNTKTDAGTKYYYKVRAIHTNSAANGAYSSAVSRICDLARPDVKISLSSAGKPKLSWKAVSGASSYEIYRSTSKNGTYTKVKTTKSVSYTNTGAVKGTKYYYKVKAVYGDNTAANSAYSATVYIQSK